MSNIIAINRHTVNGFDDSKYVIDARDGFRIGDEIMFHEDVENGHMRRIAARVLGKKKMGNGLNLALRFRASDGYCPMYGHTTIWRPVVHVLSGSPMRKKRRKIA